MKLNQKAIGLAFGTVSAIISFICVIFIAIAPVATMSFFGWLIHMDNLAGIMGTRTITLFNAIIGIASSFVAAYLIGWLFAVLYNKFARRETQ